MIEKTDSNIIDMSYWKNFKSIKNVDEKNHAVQYFKYNDATYIATLIRGNERHIKNTLSNLGFTDVSIVVLDDERVTIQFVWKHKKDVLKGTQDQYLCYNKDTSPKFYSGRMFLASMAMLDSLK